MIQIELEPYIEKKLDCFQNLVISLLQKEGLELQYLGAVWPWLFQLKPRDGGGMRIQTADTANRESLRELYDISLITYYFQDDEFWPLVQEQLHQELPVIVAIDQFYVPHHFPHVYQKQHGFHTLTITGYVDDLTEIFCCDAIPPYQGKMPFKLLLEGVRQQDHWCSVMHFPEGVRNPEPEMVWGRLLNGVKLCSTGTDRPAPDLFSTECGHVTSADLVRMLDKWVMDDDAVFCNKLQRFCEGNWGWEVERRGEWLITYLNMPEVVARCLRRQEIMQLIGTINREWMLAYRLLFKGLQGKLRESYIKAKEKLDRVLEMETQLAAILLSEYMS